MKTQLNPIGVSTAIFQGLVHRPSHQFSRMSLVQLQDADELANAATILPLGLQVSQKTLVDRRPLLASAPDRLGMLEGAWALF
jgi:hypothetical protein